MGRYDGIHSSSTLPIHVGAAEAEKTHQIQSPLGHRRILGGTAARACAPQTIENLPCIYQILLLLLPIFWISLPTVLTSLRQCSWPTSQHHFVARTRDILGRIHANYVNEVH